MLYTRKPLFLSSLSNFLRGLFQTPIYFSVSVAAYTTATTTLSTGQSYTRIGVLGLGVKVRTQDKYFNVPRQLSVPGSFSIVGGRARGGVTIQKGFSNRAVCYSYWVTAPVYSALIKVGLLAGGCKGGSWPLVRFFWARYLRKYVAYCLAPPFRINFFWRIVG